jgi:tetratricopeptide (TPR) repeat protein
MNSLLYSFFSGDWEIAKEYKDDLVNQNLKNIDIMAPSFVAFQLHTQLERGHYAEAEAFADKLSNIGNVYEHEYSIVKKYYFNTILLTKYRKLREALIEANEGINFIIDTAFTIYLFGLYSIKARISMMMGDFQEAENTLQYANDIKSKIYPLPFFLTHFFESHFIFNLFNLDQSIKTKNNSDIAKNKKKTFKSAKKAIRNSQKVAFDQIETYRLMGTYYWLINKQKRALKWWRRSITVGERIEGRLELSRTYFEIGKCLLEPNSNSKKLNGITAEEYLEKARTMFEEMGLQWDLDKLDLIISMR